MLVAQSDWLLCSGYPCAEKSFSQLPQMPREIHACFIPHEITLLTAIFTQTQGRLTGDIVPVFTEFTDQVSYGDADRKKAVL